MLNLRPREAEFLSSATAPERRPAIQEVVLLDNQSLFQSFLAVFKSEGGT